MSLAFYTGCDKENTHVGAEMQKRRNVEILEYSHKIASSRQHINNFPLPFRRRVKSELLQSHTSYHVLATRVSHH